MADRLEAGKMRIGREGKDPLMAGEKRFTIGLGFLSDFILETYSSGIFKSVREACAEADLDFIGFEGGFSRVFFELYNQQKNAVIDLVDKGNLDGMILLAEHAANTMTDLDIKRVFRNLSGVPIVSIGYSPKAAASILIDNTRSMRDLVVHLIHDHGYRRIAFLNGPATSRDGKNRFEAYQETLREFGVPIREKLIVYDGDFYSSGADAVKTLLDERRAAFDAIVAANDSMAIFAMKELKRRGIRVPADIAVTGFDDIESGHQLSLGLTTVRQSFFDIGRESVRTMRAILAGETVPHRIVLPTRLVVRESCGCTDADKIDRILSRDGAPVEKKKRAGRRDSPDRDFRPAAELEKRMPSLFEKPGVKTAVQELARALPDGADETGRRNFIKRIGTLFGRLFEMEEDLGTVYRLTVSFFSAAAADGDDPRREKMLRTLREESLILAGLSAQLHQAGREVRIKEKEGNELIINDDFAALLHIDRLREIVSMQLPKMQFKHFYVCLYTDPSRLNAKLLMQYHSGPGVRAVPDRSQFPAKHLLPGFRRNSANFAYMVVALFFEETELGYVLFDITDLHAEPSYDDLANQISGAINGAMQAKAIHEYTGQLEEKVRDRTRQLELAARERADFFNDIAHEIKNPLTLISNYLDAYIAKQGLSEELKVLKSNFEALLEVMVDYLSREKIERGKIVYRHGLSADASAIVGNDVILFRESARRKDVRLADAIEPGVFVSADPEALERVVENLLHNAVRFTNPGGGIKVALRRKGDRVEFSVKDTGIGLSPDQLQHIFERYYQANAEGEGPVGSGLGLDIVKKIIDELGASIRVTSAKGRGTTFTCRFSSSRSPARSRVVLSGRTAPRAALDTETEAPLEGRGNLFFVEDNAELLAYLVENTKAIFNVDHANNGLDALESLKRISKPNIIVSDVLMDKMDGYRFFEELMKDDDFRDVPFLFLTGVNSRMDRLKALNQGAVDYIAKPFRIDELIAKIQSILRIQEALKKKNVLLLGSQLYRAIEDRFLEHDGGRSDGGIADFNQLLVKHGISRKEIEVISLLKLGLVHKQIAARLNISIYTVRTHIARVYKKCHVNSALELFAKLKSL
jgi:signal transduction histidine kinase/DNA-binding LacI/PurR family transcriptional regulator/DNA-binding NarL/FixJ family response regulator